MKVGSQSTLNDLALLDSQIEAINATISKLNSDVSQFADINNLHTFMKVRPTLTTEDFFVIREPGIYKIQNGSQTPNPNRPPELRWGLANLYGSLVVYRSEINGENRTVIDFLSDGGARFTAHSNNGGWSEWSEIPVIGETAIVDADGFIKTV
ncbi:pyocin knob domain-containing protein [Rhodanobacter aciditrophus]|uniref:Pyocin knob domain-containing protein n=1 Tax=Rhodanobacter aciditrophus TaxID=1623218 RepID=A0ABW4B265_9GAMM